MNPFYSLLAFEKAGFQDKKRKIFLLKFVNYFLMGLILFIILIVLSCGSFFYFPISNDVLFLLLLIYLFFNLMSFLIQKGFVRLPAILIIVLMLFILFKATWFFGVDFYAIDIVYPLIILTSAILIDVQFAIFIFLLIASIFFLTLFLRGEELKNSNINLIVSLPVFLNTIIILTVYAMTVFLLYFWFKGFDTKTKKIKNTHLEKLLKLAPILDLGKLTVGLICEIRNQLSIVSIVLQNAQTDKNTIRDLDLAVEAVEQINKLSNLGFCGLTSKPDLEVFNLNLEIKNIISLFKNKSRKRNIKIIFEPNSNYQLHADRMKLNKVLVSLIFNAIESYEKVKNNDRHIFIKLVKKPRSLLIKVKDYGVGINQNDLPLIFTPYFTSKDRSKSLGLSLYASQKVMREIYETRIRVESLLGVGSTFTLYIKNKFLLI